MSEMDVVAEGLQFPEGPIAMPDGSVVLVEIARGTVSRVQPDGTIEVVADCGGGPNGIALGPDGRVYVCNNGGMDTRVDDRGRTRILETNDGYVGGSIQAVDLDSGEVETLYTEVGGHRLSAPNDLVFDADGGFWFTDHGKQWERQRDHGGIYYARPDGSSIAEVSTRSRPRTASACPRTTPGSTWPRPTPGGSGCGTSPPPVGSTPPTVDRPGAGCWPACPASSSSTPSPSTARTMCAWPRSATVGSATSPPTGRLTTCRPATG